MPRPPVPELRQDPLTGEWISIAVARQNRAFLPPDELDPLAPCTEGNPTEVPDYYDVAVFEIGPQHPARPWTSREQM